jgi:RecA/RadA recombinase
MAERTTRSTGAGRTRSEKSLSDIDALIRSSRKKYGETAIMTASELLAKQRRILVPTGSFALDCILGGGFPIGVPVGLYGNAGSGKTMLANSAAANYLRMFPESRAFCVVTEGDVPSVAWELFGMDLGRLHVILQSEYGERTMNVLYDILDALQQSDPDRLAPDPVAGVILIDSISGLLPVQDKTKLDSEGLEGKTMGTHAKLVSEIMNKFVGTGKFANALAVVTSQVRQDVGAYVPTDKPTGGNAFLHYTKLRIKLTSSHASSRKVTYGQIEGLESLYGMEWLKGASKDLVIGHIVEAEVVRNSTYARPPRGTAISPRTAYRVIYDYGFDNYSAVLETAISIGQVVVSGSYFQWQDLRVQGKHAFLLELTRSGKWPEFERLIRELVFTRTPATIAGATALYLPVAVPEPPRTMSTVMHEPMSPSDHSLLSTGSEWSEGDDWDEEGSDDLDVETELV